MFTVFLLQSEDIHGVSLIGVCKLTVGVNVSIIDRLCVSLLLDWPSVQGLPCVMSCDGWDRLQWKWKRNGWMYSYFKS